MEVTPEEARRTVRLCKHCSDWIWVDQLLAHLVAGHRIVFVDNVDEHYGAPGRVLDIVVGDPTT